MKIKTSLPAALVPYTEKVSLSQLSILRKSNSMSAAWLANTNDFSMDSARPMGPSILSVEPDL